VFHVSKTHGNKTHGNKQESCLFLCSYFLLILGEIYNPVIQLLNHAESLRWGKRRPVPDVSGASFPWPFLQWRGCDAFLPQLSISQLPASYSKDEDLWYNRNQRGV